MQKQQIMIESGEFKYAKKVGEMIGKSEELIGT